ncbi:unnamed protein product [Mesocestoides corti]|uniref:J domain-containing protein n=2 Tax=Mesocestoides corti TaxID=53468 RepID=A0A3P6HPE5_MESCO|nr:unnamed protein product [Mesocestoides corti]
MGISRDADVSAVQRAYRALAKEHHPDRQKTPQDKVQAKKTFHLIATAYGILRDPEQRQEYEYMLDNPSEMYYHYYRYFRRRYSPKVDVRVVIVATVLILSAIQYISQKTKHDQAIAYLVRDPKHRNKARELALAENRFRVSKQEVGRRLTRDELKAREEDIIRSIIVKTVDLRGDCGPPSIRHTLLLQLFFFPYHVVRFCWWALRWVILFWILQRPYGSEEQEFLTRWRLGYSQARWEGLDAEKRAHFNQLGLWDREKFKAYMLKVEEEVRIRAAEDTNQKRYRRYMKRNGPPAINLDDL